MIVIIILIVLCIAFFIPKPNGHGSTCDTCSSKMCTCLGIESDSNTQDSWASTCFGVPINCVEYNNIAKVPVQK